MKPESILQTDLLDILFNNRNKEYGAYTLRKQYNARLGKAVMFTFGLAFFLSVSWYVQANYLKNSGGVAGQLVTEVYLKKLDEMKKPQELKPHKSVAKKMVAQVASTTIKIVPDDKADKQVPKNEDLNNKLIGLQTTEGAPDDGSNAAPAATEGDKNGAVIEPKKEEPAAEMMPLVRAEVMPEFPGGPVAFQKFMLRNLRQPDDLQEGEKVVVLIKFVVEADGSIVNAEVLKSGGKYDDDVLKVVKKMPRWKPGMQNGKYVPVYFTLPVTFSGAGE